MTISPYVIDRRTVEVVGDGHGLTKACAGRDAEDRSLLDVVLADFEWATR